MSRARVKICINLPPGLRYPWPFNQVGAQSTALVSTTSNCASIRYFNHYRFRSPMVHGDVWQTEVANESVKEGNRLSSRFDKRQGQLRVHQAKGNAWNARTGPDIQGPHRPARQESPEEQRIEKESTRDVGARSERREVMRAVPENEKIGVAAEGVALCRRRGSAQQGREGLEEILERVGRGSGHAVTETVAGPAPGSRLLHRTRPVCGRAAAHVELLCDRSTPERPASTRPEASEKHERENDGHDQHHLACRGSPISASSSLYEHRDAHQDGQDIRGSASARS